MDFFNVTNEFEKHPELKKEDLNHLKEWMSKQPHLPPITDELLILFLHSCFYQLEPTKVNIESYFTFRTHSPELFTNRDPELKSVIDMFNIISFSILPKFTPDGCKVLFIGLKRTEPELFVLADFIKVLSMVIDMLLMTSGTFDGLIILYDMKGFGLSHIGRLDINLMKKYVYLVQNSIPARLKYIHTININQYLDLLNTFKKPFMKKEFLEKVFYHQVNSETIYEYVPKHMMPSDVGGNGKSLQDLNEDTINAVKGMRKWFLDEEHLRVDEKKRSGKPKTENDIFGVQYSFKTLCLD